MAKVKDPRKAVAAYETAWRRGDFDRLEEAISRGNELLDQVPAPLQPRVRKVLVAVNTQLASAGGAADPSYVDPPAPAKAGTAKAVGTQLKELVVACGKRWAAESTRLQSAGDKDATETLRREWRSWAGPLVDEAPALLDRAHVIRSSRKDLQDGLWYVASRAVHIGRRELAARAIGEMLDGALSDDVDDIARLLEDCQANGVPDLAQMLFDGLPEKLRRTKRIKSAWASR